MIPVCRDEISRCPAGTDLTYDYMWKLNFVPARWDSFLPVICLDLYVISLEFSLKPCKNWLGSFYFKAFGTTASPASIFGFIENKFGINWVCYTPSAAVRSPQPENIFLTSEPQLSSISSDLFRILSINETDSSFSTFDGILDADGGTRHKNRLFVTEEAITSLKQRWLIRTQFLFLWIHWRTYGQRIFWSFQINISTTTFCMQENSSQRILLCLKMGLKQSIPLAAYYIQWDSMYVLLRRLLPRCSWKIHPNKWHNRSR